MDFLSATINILPSIGGLAIILGGLWKTYRLIQKGAEERQKFSDQLAVMDEHLAQLCQSYSRLNHNSDRIVQALLANGTLKIEDVRTLEKE